MTEDFNPNETEEASERLEAGFRQCRELVAELRHRLVSQSSDPFAFGDDAGDNSNLND